VVFNVSGWDTLLLPKVWYPVIVKSFGLFSEAVESRDNCEIVNAGAAN